MSGIFLYFDPSGISKTDKKKFSKLCEGRIIRIPGDPVETLERDFMVGAVVHHGVLPSGGVAAEGDTALLVSGSCWISPEDDFLGTPSLILQAFNSTSTESRPPFGGTFALAHFDETRRELTVESDRFGAMPLYFKKMGGGVAVSSEIKFLAAAGSHALNSEAFAELMSFGYLPRPHTLLEGIERLVGNSRLICNRDGLMIHVLPTPGYPRNRPVNDEVIEEYDARIRRFLNRFKGVSREYSISLSGGLDSRLVGAAAQRDGFPLEAFTVGEPGSLEVRVARQVADLLKIPIRVHEIDGRAFPRYFEKMVWFTESRVMPEHMHYMSANFSRSIPPGPQFHGLAGETVMGGHFDIPSLLNASPDKIREACRDSAQGLIYWNPGSRTALLGEECAARAKVAREAAIEELFGRIGFSGSYSDFLEFKYRFRMEAFSNPCLMSQVLPWSDVICPFLDSEAFDFGASLELEGIRSRAGQIKWGRNHLPVIMELPRIKAGVQIDVRDEDPQAYEKKVKWLMLRRKFNYYVCRLSQGRINFSIRRSFPHYGQWYRRWKPVRDYVDGILLSDRTLDRGLYRREGLRRMLRDCRVGRDTWGTVSTLLLTEIFLRQFVEGESIPEDATTPWGLDP